MGIKKAREKLQKVFKEQQQKNSLVKKARDKALLKTLDKMIKTKKRSR